MADLPLVKPVRFSVRSNSCPDLSPAIEIMACWTLANAGWSAPRLVTSGGKPNSSDFQTISV